MGERPDEVFPILAVCAFVLASVSQEKWLPLSLQGMVALVGLMFGVAGARSPTVLSAFKRAPIKIGVTFSGTSIFLVYPLVKFGASPEIVIGVVLSFLLSSAIVFTLIVHNIMGRVNRVFSSVHRR